MTGTDTNIVDDMNASMNCARQNNNRIRGLQIIVMSRTQVVSCSWGDKNRDEALGYSLRIGRTQMEARASTVECATGTHHHQMASLTNF